MGIYKGKREHTKGILIDSFWELYEKKSIGQITIKEITDKAGYNRATFYMHFKDINDILQCIEDKLLEYFDEMFRLADVENCSQEDLLKRAIDIFTSHKRYNRILLSSKGDPYFVVKCKEKLKGHLYSFNKKNITLTEKNTEFVMEYIVSGIISSILYWFDAKPFSEEELLYNLNKLVTTCMQLQ
jgi:AcrR family transcriptional regulator